MAFARPVFPQIEFVRSLIDRRVRFDPATEQPGTVRIERGELLADRAIGIPISNVHRPNPHAAVVDAIGHTRPVYRGLLHYCLSLATAQPAGGLHGGLHGGLVNELIIQPDLFHGSTSPARLGSKITAAAWNALARFVGDRGDAQAGSFLRQIADNRSPDGPFLTAAASDNPETFWYHDLILLHAVDAYADLSGDTAARSAASAAAAYHHDQTQTDHATAEPWGLPAFLKSPATIPTADALLHAVQSNQPDGPRGVTLLLLADALYRSSNGDAAP